MLVSWVAQITAFILLQDKPIAIGKAIDFLKPGYVKGKYGLRKIT
jgi:hypothetical protein